MELTLDNARFVAAANNTFDGTMQQTLNFAMGDEFNRLEAIKEISEVINYYSTLKFEFNSDRFIIDRITELNALISFLTTF